MNSMNNVNQFLVNFNALQDNKLSKLKVAGEGEGRVFVQKTFCDKIHGFFSRDYKRTTAAEARNLFRATLTQIDTELGKAEEERTVGFDAGQAYIVVSQRVREVGRKHAIFSSNPIAEENKAPFKMGDNIREFVYRHAIGNMEGNSLLGKTELTDEEKRVIINDLSEDRIDKIYKENLKYSIRNCDDENSVKNYIEKLDEVRSRRRIIKAKVADHYGFASEKAKGATGTVFVTDINGKKLGVFKSDKVSGWTRTLNWFKRNTRGQLRYLSDKPLAQPLTEVLAYRLNNHFGFGIAPHTAKTNALFGTEGVFQLLARPGDKESNVVKDADEVGAGNFDLDDRESIDQFQKLVLFDILLGNLDRHDENWMVEVERDEVNVKIIKLTAIDNANSFPKENPSEKLKNQFAWCEHPLANYPLSENTIALIESMETKGIDGFINAVKDHDDLKILNEETGDSESLLDADMQRLLTQRFNFILSLKERDIKLCEVPGDFFNFINTSTTVDNFEDDTQ